MEATEAMASIALVLALVPLQKCPIDFKISNGSALCKMKLALHSQR